VPVSPRDPQTRKADTLAMLETPESDCWVASSSGSGPAHLVPLSLAWLDERAVIAVPESSVTSRNIAATRRARVAVGPTPDVVMIDAVLDRSTPVGDDDELGNAYAAQADWDPRNAGGYVFLVLKPVRVQAWRESDEIAGRTLMRDGAWVV
jgi:hypothetical protein